MILSTHCSYVLRVIPRDTWLLKTDKEEGGMEGTMSIETSASRSARRERLVEALPVLAVAKGPDDLQNRIGVIEKTLDQIVVMAVVLLQQSERLREDLLPTDADRYRNVLHFEALLESTKHNAEHARKQLNKMCRGSLCSENTPQDSPLAF